MEPLIILTDEYREVKGVMGLKKESAFEAGDVVQLPSGGPLMTVTDSRELTKRDYVFCVWFDKEDHLQHTDFPAEILQHVKR